jgi:hypothetical protein
MPRPFLLALAPLLLSACCTQAPRNAGPLPPPISPLEQITRLNARIAALPRLRATTVLRGVELHYPDQQGRDHADNFEGILLMHQREQAAGWDVRLVGRAFDQEVMQAGANQRDWWFIIRLDQKIALVGDASRPFDLSRLTPETPAPSDSPAANPLASGILRADLVPQLLGLSPLSQGHSPRDPNVAMIVDDLQGTNNLFIVSSSGFGVAIQRQIIVDRRTGDISEVRLFNPAGQLVVRSLLRNYQPVDGAPAGIRMPYDMQLDYPSQKVRVLLKIDRMSAPSEMSPILTPDFEEQGLQVRHID